MYKFFIIGLVVAAVAAVPAPEADVVKGVKDIDCLQQDEDIFSCLAVKAVNYVSRAARSSDFQVIDGISFVKEANVPAERSGKSLESETDLLKVLPRDTIERTMKLASMFFESAITFFKSHSLKVNIPEASIARGLVEGLFSPGRGKFKKMLLPLAAAAGVKIIALIPILLGGLALLVVKALVVGKIALLLAGVLAFQKLFGAGGSGISAGSLFGKNTQTNGWSDGQSSQGWNSAAATAQSQGYYKRSFDENAKEHAQMLAYSAQAPVTNETN